MARRVENFRAGQQAYNQLVTNLRNIKRLKNEQNRLSQENEGNAALLRQIERRFTNYPESLRSSERQRYAKILRSRVLKYERFANVQRRLRETKRRVLNVIPVRFRPLAHHPVPYNIHVLNQWSPTGFIAALQLFHARKASKSGLNYVTRPGGPTSMRLLAEHVANRKRPASSSPNRNRSR